MNTKSLIAAAALFTAAISPAFAADGAQAAAAPAASSAAVTASAQALNLPLTSVTIPASRSRAEVNAEAVDFVAHYKTALQVQLELANN